MHARLEWQRLAKFLPGIALAGAVAWCAMASSPMRWPQAVGFSALTLAIVFGIILGNSLYPRIAHHCALGVCFCKQTVLRTGIVLFGLWLTFQDIANVGVLGWHALVAA